MKGAPRTACQRVTWFDVAPETLGKMFALRLIVRPGDRQGKIDYMCIPGCKLMYSACRGDDDGREYYCPDEESGEFDKLPLDWLISPEYVSKAESTIVVFVKPAPGLAKATAEFHSPYLLCSSHYEISCELDAPAVNDSQDDEDEEGGEVNQEKNTIGGIGRL